MKKLESFTQFEELKQGEATIFMFSADWCKDCRAIEPELPEIEKTNQHVQFIYVDRDEYIDLCSELTIFGIPSFLAFKSGHEVGRFVSKDRKTKEEINDFVKGLSF